MHRRPLSRPNPPCLPDHGLLYASPRITRIGLRNLCRTREKIMNLVKKLFVLLVTLGGLMAVTTPAVRAENWPQWRGPFFNGSTTEKGLPTTFSKTENVKWVAGLPGPSAATPVIWSDRVFVSSVDQKVGTLQALCLDRGSGKILWKKEAGVGLGLDDRSNFASPSPVTDGKLAWFFYGNGQLVAFDLDGREAWSRNIQK